MRHTRRKFTLLILVLAALFACTISPTVTPQPTVSTEAPKAPETIEPAAATVTNAPTQPESTITALPEPTMPPLVGDPVPVLPSGAAVNIRTIRMLNETSGWAIGFLPGSMDSHILRTTDGGGTWQQVTPPQPWQESAYTGMTPAMAVLSVDELFVVYGGGPAPIVVWHTLDGGSTWTYSAPLEQPAIMDLFLPSDLIFVDQQHGWLMAHLGAGMNHDYIAIYRTTDSGATWEPVVNPDKNNLTMSFSKNGINFVTTSRGWVTGSTNGVYDDLFLYQTDDGGETWFQPSLPAPEGNPDYFQITGNMCVSYSAMIYANHVIIPVQCNDYNSSIRKGWLYTSQDAGMTWNLHSIPAVFSSRYAFLNLQTGWMIGEKQIYHIYDMGQTWTGPKVVTWDGEPWFLNTSTGWVAAYNDDRSEYALVRTLDGGQNWSKIGTIIK